MDLLTLRTGPWPGRLLLLVALLAALAAGERLHAAWQAARDNARMQRGEAPPGSPAMLLLAQADRLAAAGQTEEALQVYAEAEVRGGPLLRHAVRVNVANLHLRRGIESATVDGHAQRALVLLQLAKSGYRRALRERPDDRDARYNFELAQRLLPDVEVRNWRRSGHEAEVEEALRRDRAAWSEMIGTPRGLH